MREEVHGYEGLAWGTATGWIGVAWSGVARRPMTDEEGGTAEWGHTST